MRALTTEDVYRYYLGDVVIGNMYNSPLPGRRDSSPSFALYEKNGEILWIDHGLPNQYGNKPENLIQHLRGLPLTPGGYYKAQKIIAGEVQRGMRGKSPTSLRRRAKNKNTPYIRGREVWRGFETEYWRRFDIDTDFLREEWVEPLDMMSWSGDEKAADLRSVIGDPAFVYWWSRNPASWKLYRPLTARKRDKFRQGNPTGVIEGWDVMKKQVDGRLGVLFILSSSKDRFVVKKAFGELNRYNGINPRGESDRMDIIAMRSEIADLADRVIILYDADRAGYEGSHTLSDKTGFETYDMRNLLDGQKDFSDYVDTQRGNHSHSKLKDLIKSICKI
jgi:hypothetical protein